MVLTHNLGLAPDNYTVDLWFQDTDPAGAGINTRGYGGYEAAGSHHGGYWKRLELDFYVQAG